MLEHLSRRHWVLISVSYLVSTLILSVHLDQVICTLVIAVLLHSKWRAKLLRSQMSADSLKQLIFSRSIVRLICLVASGFFLKLLLVPTSEFISYFQSLHCYWIFAPAIIYSSFGLFITTILSLFKSRLQDKRQLRYDLSMLTFALAYCFSVLSICMATNGPATWVGGWLIASGLDANLGGMTEFIARQCHLFNDHYVLKEAGSEMFVGQLRVALSLLALIVSSKPALTLNATLAKLCDSFARGGSNLLERMEAAIQSFRSQEIMLKLKEERPWTKNVLKTCLWIIGCYSLLFWLFGFSEGPFAASCWTGRYLIGSCDKFRIFIASIVALWGTAPFAISSSVFLPYKSAEKIVLSNEGILFPSKFNWQLGFRNFRSWSDCQAIKADDSYLSIDFHSGSGVKISLASLGKDGVEQISRKAKTESTKS